MQRSSTGGLELTNFEKFITIICWWQPFIALISLLFGSAPRQLKRHAKWAVLTVIVMAIVAALLGLLLAGVGYLAAGEQAASTGVIIGRVYAILMGLAALANTLAIIVGRGPYFDSADPAGARFR